MQIHNEACCVLLVYVTTKEVLNTTQTFSLPIHGKRNLLDLELVVSYGVTCFNHTIPQVKCGILCSLEITFVGMFSVTLLTEKRIQSAEQSHD